MNQNKLVKNLPYLFCAAGVLVLIVSMFANRGYFDRLACANVFWYQTKQVLSLLVLFFIGYAFVKVIQHRLSELWVCLLSVPSAVCLWCFCSEFLLLADFTYRFWRVCFLMGAGILACYLFRRLRRIPMQKITLPVGKTLAVVVGVACLVSTGWTYVLLNYDSYFYFSDYGKALTLMMSYKDIVSDNSFVMTNIGQFLPLVSSYMTYWGLDSGAPVLGFFIVNLLSAFGVAVYEQVRGCFSKKRAALYTVFSLLLLTSCTIFFIYTNWILSNTYIMFYLFFLFYLGKEHWDTPSVDRALLIGIYALAVTMLRKDGLVIVCFVFVCYSVRKLYPSPILAALFVPSAAYQLFYIYYLRHIIYAWTTLAFGTSLLNEDFVKLLFLGVAGTLVYLLVLHFPAEKLFKKYLPHMMTIFLIAVLCCFLLKDVTNSIDYVDVWLRNMGGYGFGYAIFGILLLAVLTLIAKPRYCYSMFFIVGYALIIFIIYRQKLNLEVGLDNSGLRALYQIIPVFYYAAMTTIAPLFTDASLTQPIKEDVSDDK